MAWHLMCSKPLPVLINPGRCIIIWITINLLQWHFMNENCFHSHDDVIKWKHFPRYWPFVRGIHRSPMNSPLKGQWRGALMFSLIWINGWVNNRKAGDLRRHRAHCDVIVMISLVWRRSLLWLNDMIWNLCWSYVPNFLMLSRATGWQ